MPEKKKGLRPKKRTVGKAVQEYRIINMAGHRMTLHGKQKFRGCKLEGLKEMNASRRLQRWKNWKRRYTFPK